MGFFSLEIQRCAAVTWPLLRGCSEISKAPNQAGIPNDPPNLCAGSQAGAGGGTEGRGGTDGLGVTLTARPWAGTDGWDGGGTDSRGGDTGGQRDDTDGCG